jgi:hypothetical protein
VVYLEGDKKMNDMIPHARTKLLLQTILNYTENKQGMKEELYWYLPEDLRDDFLYAIETDNYE